MSYNAQQSNEPVVFVNAEVKQSQNGSWYIWSHTIDLQQVIAKLGTSVITITMIKPKNARSERERLLIIKAGDPQYLRQEKSKGNGANGRNASYSPHHDNGLI
jgi:hypothetical protein